MYSALRRDCRTPRSWQSRDQFSCANCVSEPIGLSPHNDSGTVSAFGLIPLGAEAALAPFREVIEFPNSDFAAFCAGLWRPGNFSAKAPGELKMAMSNAFAADGPVIVDAIVVPDELPNLPHLDLKLLGHLAKVMEAALAVTGA